ncbi:MAG: hypothetical protein H6625_05615 [Bdellovibrionaceae bacterium]|nr:hypothetical protein [Pseudobdellovibrionaceae bacterium]
MGNFKAELINNGSVSILKLEGHIDEDANLETIPKSKAQEIEIDFQKIVAINSCGIREWIKWLKSIPPNVKVFYINCPKIIVDQVNMVAGFIPDNGKIKSFYVPYYAESSDSEKMVLFTEGKEFLGSNIQPPKVVKDDQTGEEMEMDVIESKYFKFLKG